MAEVLITLGIIGVVAAMSIPTLMQKIRYHALEVQFKHTYSVLNQAYLTMKEDNGGSFVGIATSYNELTDAFAKYIKQGRVCHVNSEIPCWANDWYSFNGFKIGGNDGFRGGIIFLNGALMNINSFSATCTSNVELKEPIGCVRLRVDVNGLNKPNTVGRDIFDFYVTDEYGIIPRGSNKTNVDMNNEWGRAAYLLKNGKMDY